MNRVLALVPLVALIGVACKGRERQRAAGPGAVVSESAAPFRLPVGDTTAARDTMRDTARADTAHTGTASGTSGSTASVADTGAATAPLAFVAADSAAGDSLYHGRGRCFTCHGPLGAGVANLGTSLRGPDWLDGDGSLTALMETIRNGVASPVRSSIPMPGYASMLTPRQVYQLAAYTYTLSHRGAIIPDSIARQAAARQTTTPPLPPAGPPAHPPGA